MPFVQSGQRRKDGPVFRIADRYVLRQVAKPLVTAMTIGLLVLLAERMVRLLDTTLGKKNSFGVVFEMLAYLAPHYLGLALPAALFLGLLFGFNRMSRDSEVDAFLASGVGVHRLGVAAPDLPAHDPLAGAVADIGVEQAGRHAAPVDDLHDAR